MVMLADSINRGVVQCSQQKVDIDVSPFQPITHGHKKKRKKEQTKMSKIPNPPLRIQMPIKSRLALRLMHRGIL